MRKEIFQENKARWEVLEQIGTLRSKLFWAALAAFIALAALYTFALR